MNWTSTASWAFVAGLVMILLVALGFVLGLSYRRSGRSVGSAPPASEPWGQCPQCSHATAPNTLTCIHCGFQLRPAKRQESL
jgi:hypothetical protein